MPKAEKGSVKDIAKRIKAKGLQKLKFYCEMCGKQCRDANGFKCHLSSESHMRQMKLFGENASGIMNQKSHQFEKAFVDHLRLRHSTAKVNANNVYQEVIRDKHHVHMNATMWATLSDFCKYLGRKGICMVEETERGWYLQYIDRNVDKMQLEQALQDRLKAEQQAEKVVAQRMQEQRVAAIQAAGGIEQVQATELDRSAVETVQVSLDKNGLRKRKRKTTTKPSVFRDESDSEDEGDVQEGTKSSAMAAPSSSVQPSAVKKHKIESTSKSSSTLQARASPDDAGFLPDILVRIVDDKSRFFKRKAAVDRVKGRIVHVTVLDSGPETYDGGQTLSLDQKLLDTVIPKQTGKKVVILRGKYRSQVAVVRKLDKKRYLGTLELVSGGEVLQKVDYEDFSKAC